MSDICKRCDQPKACSGLCVEHYNEKVLARFVPLAANFGDPDVCWIWEGTLHKGYGSASYGIGQRRENRAYRVSWRLFRGEIPEGMSIDHLCRETRCVNPAHLEVVSRWENLRRGWAAHEPDGIPPKPFRRPTPAKRSYGSGSKRERRHGVWELRVGGHSQTFYGGSRDAERELSKLVARQDSRIIGAGASTLGELVEEWLAVAQIQRSTRQTYEAALAHLPDKARAWKLRRLALRDFDRLYVDLDRAGLSANVVRKLHTVLSAALSEALRWGWLDVHPARGARLPALPDRQVKPPSTATLARIVAAADASPDFIDRVWIRIALAAGLRRGELLALRWSNVDLDGGVVTVAASIEEDRTVKSTKTNRSRRVRLDPDTVALLQRWKVEEAKRALAAGVPLARDPWVLSGDASSAVPWRPDGATQRFRRLCARAGVTGVRLHDLRHAHVSLLLKGGVPIQDVSPRVGHERTSTTHDVYAHTMDDADVRAATVIGDALRTLNGA